MATDLQGRLDSLAAASMLRQIPAGHPDGAIADFSTNDYLGLAADPRHQERFMAEAANRAVPFTSSASRLLASRQEAYSSLESTIDSFYPGRRSLLLNSGYHANTGILPALPALFNRPLILADKLVHASIIDGIVLSRADFRRFPHNDLDRLEKMLARAAEGPDRPDGIIIVVESVYSMDGDRADIGRLIDLRRHYRAKGVEVMIYVDEAHAIGVEGPSGLGLVAAAGERAGEVDVVVGTFGKALASAGAFALTGADLRAWIVNCARSFIFSTSLPPIVARWSEHMFAAAAGADTARATLATYAAMLDPHDRRYIYPAVTGSAESAIALSQRLADELAIKVLPIRTPTVPPGTERLRISLSAALDRAAIVRLRQFLDTNLPQ